MSCIVVYRYHRPDPSIPWHTNVELDPQLTLAVLDLSFTEFHGRKIRTINETDPLTLEVEIVWESQEVYEDYASREVIIQSREAIKQYNDSVGITADPVEITIA